MSITCTSDSHVIHGKWSNGLQSRPIWMLNIVLLAYNNFSLFRPYHVSMHMARPEVPATPEYRIVLQRLLQNRDRMSILTKTRSKNSTRIKQIILNGWLQSYLNNLLSLDCSRADILLASLFIGFKNPHSIRREGLISKDYKYSPFNHRHNILTPAALVRLLRLSGLVNAIASLWRRPIVRCVSFKYTVWPAKISAQRGWRLAGTVPEWNCGWRHTKLTICSSRTVGLAIFNGQSSNIVCTKDCPIFNSPYVYRNNLY